MVKRTGDENNNSLVGTDQTDQLFGLGGSDRLEGLAGGDLLDGGAGFDRAIYGKSGAGVIIDLRTGFGFGGHAQGDLLVSIENVDGSKFDDDISGDDSDNILDGAGFILGDTLRGFGGRDQLRGGGLLDGGSGADELDGLGGIDLLFGGSGDDRLDGKGGGDLIDGGAGIDTVFYEASNAGVFISLASNGAGVGGHAQGDEIVGVENVTGSSHDDIILGSGVRNEIDGFGGDDQIAGQGGDDVLDGGFDDDELFGGDGIDLLIGGFGADTLDGGAGIDTAHYLHSSAGVFVDLSQNLAGFGEAEGDTFTGVENLDGSSFFDTLFGNGLANRLFGDGGNDTLDGRGGSDKLIGGGGDDLMRGGDGDDVLDGQSGKDAMVGGAGNDTYFVSEVGEIVDEATGGSGVDTVDSRISFSLNGPAVKGDVERLTLSGNLDIDANGNALNNVLIGNGGQNRLSGQAGADTMRGGGGDDVYFVGEAGDVVDESGASGVDSVRSTISFDLSGAKASGSVEKLTLLGSGALNGHGNVLDNVLRGNGGVNVLTGAGGDDTLTGNGGADFFVFASGLDAATNVDVITDFDVPQDTIRLENAFFTGLANGMLGAGAFRIGAAAADASDRIVYNDDTGALSFDADGSGAKAAIRFATLEGGLAMTNADFFVI